MTTTVTRAQQTKVDKEPPGMSLRTMWWFMALAFGLGWGVAALMMLGLDTDTDVTEPRREGIPV